MVSFCARDIHWEDPSIFQKELLGIEMELYQRSRTYYTKNGDTELKKRRITIFGNIISIAFAVETFSTSLRGASSWYTEYGPPDKIMPFGRQLRSWSFLCLQLVFAF